MEKKVAALRTKPFEEITLEDIAALISTRVPEGEQIEFKRGLPERKGNQDSWADGRTISDYATREILHEVVAFANTYGGTLVLGIAESTGRPAIAEQVAPIVDCENLAERLKLVLRDGVEPQIPGVEVKAIGSSADAGVVVLRTPRSRLAPHRVKKSRHCRIRRSDRCEEMTMREIQDMTLNVSRGLERLERILTGRREKFGRECETLGNQSGAFGIRITAIPIGLDLQTESVVRNGTVDTRFAPPAVHVSRVDSDDRPDGRSLAGIDVEYAMTRQNWVPRLRAVCAERVDRAQTGKLDRLARLEVHCDGVIETVFLSHVEINTPAGLSAPMPLVATVPIAEFANVCMWANQVRNVCGAPGSEYAMEVEIRVTDQPVLIEGPNNAGSSRRPWSTSMRPPGILFPRLALDSVEETRVLCEILERDLWNAMGKDIAANQGKIRVELM